jgi:predicted nucleotidyltransferase
VRFEYTARVDIRVEEFALGKQPVRFESGTPTENWRLPERIRTEPLGKALIALLNPDRSTDVAADGLNARFLEIIRLFEHHDVKFMVIGAYGVAAYGHVRNTKDVDLWVKASPDNASKVFAALKEFGVEGKCLLQKLSCEDNIVHFAGDGWAIDIMNEVCWPKFDACYPCAMSAEVEGVTVKVVSLDDLIVMKNHAGRPQDLADVAMLELRRKEHQEGET